MFEQGKICLDDAVIRLFDEYLKTYAYEKTYFDLPKAEQEILDYLAEDPNAGVALIMERLHITRGSMSQYRDRLIKKGILVSSGWGKLDFALPRFREYLLQLQEFR